MHPDYLEPYPPLSAPRWLLLLVAAIVLVLPLLTFAAAVVLMARYGSLWLLLTPAGLLWPFSIQWARSIVRGSQLTTWLEERPLILLLRSFSNDPLAYDGRLGLTEIVYTTHEEQSLDFLHEYGYCVAVGSPTERIPAFGFDRWRIRADVPWQTAVADLIGRARFVICGPGETENYFWELETALHEKRASQVVVVTNGLTPERVERAIEGRELEPLVRALRGMFGSGPRLIVKRTRNAPPEFLRLNQLREVAERAGLQRQWPRKRSVRALVESLRPAWSIFTFLATIGEIGFVGWMVWLLCTEKLSWNSLGYAMMIVVSLGQFAAMLATRK